MANQFLALSLFIMLLSFFIVINALSNFEEVKARPVLNSISLAFSSKNAGEDEGPSFEESPAQNFSDGDSLDKMEALFKSQLTGHTIKKNSLGTVMHIRLPLRSFERGVKAVGQSADNPRQARRGLGGFFLPTLVSLLQTKEMGVPYRMDMILNIPGSPARTQNQKPQQMTELINKVGAFSQSLEAAGLPKKLFSIGLSEGKKGYIDLYFRRYEPFNPLGKKAGASSNE